MASSTPKTWVNEPTKTTALNAANLIDAEERLKGTEFQASWYGAKADGTTDDSSAINEAITAANSAGGGVVRLKPGTHLVKSVLKLKDNVTLRGAGWGATVIKVYKETLISAIEANAATVVNPAIIDLQVDGNLAENAASTKAAVSLDCVHPYVERVWIKNGYVNLSTNMTTEDRSSTRPEDGIFKDIRLYDSKSVNWIFEGPHDSQISNVLAKTNEGVNLSPRKVSVWRNCHAYGNAKFSWELLGGTLLGCIGEGATQAQCIILTDGLILNDCEFFYGGGSDGKVGIEFGDATHTANSTLISGVKLEGCINGSLKWASGVNASNSTISGLVSQASGNVGAGTPGIKFHSEGLQVTGGAVDNVNSRSKASGNTIEIPYAELIEITGTTEVKKITATFVGHRIMLRFASTAKIVDGENLKLASTFEGAAERMISLICDGTNWYELGRSSN